MCVYISVCLVCVWVDVQVPKVCVGRCWGRSVWIYEYVGGKLRCAYGCVGYMGIASVCVWK